MPKELVSYAALVLVGAMVVYMFVMTRRYRAYRAVLLQNTGMQQEEMERNRQRAEERQAFYTGLLQLQSELVAELRQLRVSVEKTGPRGG